MVKVISIREFKENMKKYIDSKDVFIVSKRGEPILKVEPISPVQAAIIRMSEIIREAKLTEEELKEALKEARKTVYER